MDDVFKENGHRKEVSLGRDGKRQSYIRLGATTVIAKGENWRRLHELTARIPFDGVGYLTDRPELTKQHITPFFY